MLIFFNKFNNTEARMQDSIYLMTLKSHFISKFCTKSLDFAIKIRDVFSMDVSAPNNLTGPAVTGWNNIKEQNLFITARTTYKMRYIFR